jgi:hypothetical protein
VEIRKIASGEGYYFASRGLVYVLDWRDTVTSEGLDASVRGKREALKESPAGVAVLNLMRPFGIPSPQIRDYAEKKQNEDIAGVLCHATVIDGGGFWASAMRSTLAGLYLVGKSPFPRRVFGSVGDSAAWVATIARRPALWAVELVSAIAVIRESR